MSQRDEVGGLEERAQMAPQSITLLTLLMMAPAPVDLDPATANLVGLATIFEALQVRTQSFTEALSHKGGPEECPATEVYVPVWLEIVEEIYAEISKVNDQAKELEVMITEKIEDFKYVELRAIASCPKDGCKDRDQARELLGGFDEEGNERLM